MKKKIVLIIETDKEKIDKDLSEIKNIIKEKLNVKKDIRSVVYNQQENIINILVPIKKDKEHIASDIRKASFICMLSYDKKDNIMITEKYLYNPFLKVRFAKLLLYTDFLLANNINLVLLKSDITQQIDIKELDKNNIKYRNITENSITELKEKIKDKIFS